MIPVGSKAHLPSQQRKLQCTVNRSAKGGFGTGDGALPLVLGLGLLFLSPS